MIQLAKILSVHFEISLYSIILALSVGFMDGATLFLKFSLMLIALIVGILTAYGKWLDNVEKHRRVFKDKANDKRAEDKS